MYQPWVTIYQKTFSVKGQRINILGSIRNSFCCNLSTLPLCCEICHRQYRDKWVCLCSTKILLTQTGARVRFDPLAIVCWHLPYIMFSGKILCPWVQISFFWNTGSSSTVECCSRTPILISKLYSIKSQELPLGKTKRNGSFYYFPFSPDPCNFA